MLTAKPLHRNENLVRIELQKRVIIEELNEYLLSWLKEAQKIEELEEDSVVIVGEEGSLILQEFDYQTFY